jgi:hypothetical protein
MDPTEETGEQTCQSKNCDVIANILCGIGQPFYDALQIKIDMSSQGAPQGTTARRNVAATATAYAEPPTRVVYRSQGLTDVAGPDECPGVTTDGRLAAKQRAD